MFARYVEKIRINRWNLKEGKRVPEGGFDEANVEYLPDELEEAVEELSPVPGFLTIYGIHRVNGKKHGGTLEEAIDEAVSLWVLAQSRLGFSWSELKRKLSRFETVSNPKLARVLKNLLGAGMIEKRDGKYYIAERSLARVVLKMKV